MSSSRCRPDRQDGDVDQKFATVEILRARLSLSLVLIKGYSIIMPQGEGFLAHNEPCVVAFVSRLGCNTDGSHSSNSDISPPSIVPDRSFAVPSRPAVPHLTVSPIIMLRVFRAKDQEQISITFHRAGGEKAPQPRRLC